MQIQQKLLEAETFSDLSIITENASAHISLWGDRYVTVKGYKGFLGVADLADKVEELIMKRIPWTEKRQLGKCVSQEVERLYQELNDKQGSCWRVTKLFLQLRNFFASSGLHSCHPFTSTTLLFDSPNIEFEEDAEYNPERGLKYLQILDPGGVPAPDIAHVRIVDKHSILSNARTFDELLLVTQRSTAHLSFWGSRYITVEGYEGWLPLDALADKVKELVMKKPVWDDRLRNSGELVSEQVLRVYKECFEKENNCSWITRIFNRVRNYRFFISDSCGYEYFNILISKLFKSTEIQYIGEAEYDPANGYKYLQVESLFGPDYTTPSRLDNSPVHMVCYYSLQSAVFPSVAYVEITDHPNSSGSAGFGFFTENS